MVYMSTLAERIREIMDATRLDTAQIAKICGCSYQAVKKWENGATVSIDGEHLIALAEATGYEAKWIITGVGPKHRAYAKNEIQAEALCAMEKLPAADQYKIRAVIDVISDTQH